MTDKPIYWDSGTGEEACDVDVIIPLIDEVRKGIRDHTFDNWSMNVED